MQSNGFFSGPSRVFSRIRSEWHGNGSHGKCFDEQLVANKWPFRLGTQSTFECCLATSEMWLKTISDFMTTESDHAHNRCLRQMQHILREHIQHAFPECDRGRKKSFHTHIQQIRGALRHVRLARTLPCICFRYSMECTRKHVTAQWEHVWRVLWVGNIFPLYKRHRAVLAYVWTNDSVQFVKARRRDWMLSEFCACHRLFGWKSFSHYLFMWNFVALNRPPARVDNFHCGRYNLIND